MAPDTAAETVLDVRDIEGEPFDDIMAALAELGADETLLLINSFEPKPLYGVLEERGFTYDTSQTDGTWRIEIEQV